MKFQVNNIFGKAGNETQSLRLKCFNADVNSRFTAVRLFLLLLAANITVASITRQNKTHDCIYLERQPDELNQMSTSDSVNDRARGYMYTWHSFLPCGLLVKKELHLSFIISSLPLIGRMVLMKLLC